MALLSQFSITAAQLTANVITYTGTITSGATPLVSGMPVIVAGCVTSTFNGNFVITGGNLTTTFTVALTHANIGSEVESGAKGTVDPEGTAGAGLSGYNRVAVTTQYGADIPYGNYIPGTLPGGGQMYIEF